jgi:murein DD-endopeptidase MepM/ murein hydrolase activator NlpD
MAAPVTAAAGAALKQAAWAVARRQSRSLIGRVWKALVVISLMLVLAPAGLIVVSMLALSQSMTVGFRPGSSVDLPMICPVPGAPITQGFGPTPVALEPPGFGYPHFHTGIDLAAPAGTEVLAANDGFVMAVGVQVDAFGIPIGYGRYIKVGVGVGEEQVYGHLSQIRVVPNEIVRAGDVIAAVGSTGTSTGPHLHFELRIRAVPVDPLAGVRC